MHRGEESKGKPKRATRRRIGWGIALLVVLWLAVVGFVVGSAALDARDGQRALTALSADLSEASLQSGANDQQFEQASSSLRGAHDQLESPVLWPFKPVPWVGKQLDSASSLTLAAAETADISLHALREVRVLSEDDGASRADLLQRAATLATESNARLVQIDLGPREGLVGPLADARSQAVDELNTLNSALTRGAAASQGLSSLLTSDSRYLFVAANNAEMRNGSGMFLQAGLLTTGGGDFDVSNLVSTGDLARNANTGAINWSGDIGANWSWLGRQGDMRNMMLSPRFDANAPIAKEIWEKSGRPAVDGVIVVDVEMMRALLAVVGPVSAAGVTVDADNARETLLFDQYEGIDYDATGPRENADRREVLAGVAGLAFGKFSNGDWSLTTAAREFSSAAQGRHLLIWSTDEALNQQWVTAGVGGVMSSGDTMVSLTNLGTNKLDQFIDVASTLEVGRTDSATNVTMTITLTNNAPETGPQYVLGPIDASPAEPGEYIGMLSVSLPGDSDGISFDDDLPLSVRGRDGDNAQVAVGVDLQRGSRQTFVLRFSRPADAVFTTIQPSGHLPTMRWAFRDERWEDSAPRTLTF